MHSAIEKLRSLAEENKTILCFGIDPNMEKIDGKGGGGTTEEEIVSYYSSITDALLDENQISAIKPNYAYFAQYGFDGLRALKNIIEQYQNRTFVILDGKRGDIGKSSDAYAREVYDFWGADACTISPYMGSDSIAPFLRDGKLAYVLCRTSNEGAKDFQEKKVGRKYLYELVAEKAVGWNGSNAGNTYGLVVGATSDSIVRITKITKNKIPLLIPGIGAQGGDLKMVMNAISGKNSDPYIHRINASSSIAFAYEKQGGKPKDAALNEAGKVNDGIRKLL